MPRAKFNRGAGLLALLPFGLLVYLVVDERSGIVVKVILALIFGFLAFRAVGLRRAKADIDPGSGHLTLETDFEGPEDEREGS